MANWGQEGSFFGENVGEANLPSYMNLGTGFEPTDNLTGYFASTPDPAMETEFNSHQRGQPAERIHQICSLGQPSSDQTNINVQTTPIPKIKTEGKRDRKNEYCRKSRAKKRSEGIEMQSKLKALEAEMETKKIENAEMREELQSLTDGKDKLASDLEKLKQDNVFYQELLKLALKDKDLKKFMKEGDKHHMKRTQDQSPSAEERHSEKEISAGNLDGGDSEDDNDYNKKKKRAAHSAPSEGRSGKVRKFACYGARADERHGSTSNHTAMVRDPPSMTECIRILKTMGDTSYSIVKKARAKFESPNEREYFVELTEVWRRDWVKDLEDDA